MFTKLSDTLAQQHPNSLTGLQKGTCSSYALQTEKEGWSGELQASYHLSFWEIHVVNTLGNFFQAYEGGGCGK